MAKKRRTTTVILKPGAGKSVTLAMAKQQLSRKELAKKSGKSLKTITNIIHEESSRFQAQTLLQIAHVLVIPPTDLSTSFFKLPQTQQPNSLEKNTNLDQERIIEAAILLLKEPSGIKELRFPKLSRETGIQFKRIADPYEDNIDNLMMAIAKHVLQEMNQSIFPGNQDEPETELRFYVTAYDNFLTKYPFLIALCFELINRDEKFKTQILQAQRPLLERLGKFYQRNFSEKMNALDGLNDKDRLNFISTMSLGPILAKHTWIYMGLGENFGASSHLAHLFFNGWKS